MKRLNVEFDKIDLVHRKKIEVGTAQIFSSKVSKELSLMPSSILDKGKKTLINLKANRNQKDS